MLSVKRSLNQACTCQDCASIRVTLKRLEAEVERLREYWRDGIGDYSLLAEKVRVYRLWLRVMAKHEESRRRAIALRPGRVES